MRYMYDAIVTIDREGCYAAFPSFPGLGAHGKDYEEAVYRAGSLLREEILRRLKAGEPLPDKARNASVVAVNVYIDEDEDISEDAYMTQAEAAEELGVTPGRISAMVKTGQLQSRLIGRRKMVSIESVRAYAGTPRKSGRPQKPTS